jgi:hypothetical protein
MPNDAFSVSIQHINNAKTVQKQHQKCAVIVLVRLAALSLISALHNE